MKLNLVKFDDPVLRTPTTNYTSDELDDAIAFSTDLFDTMKAHRGIGLSATQVGIGKSIFVISIEGVDKVFINPAIIYASSDLVKEDEGCLSLPGMTLPITRPSKVNVTWIDETKTQQVSELEGLYSRVFMHEFDHLRGILIEDRVSRLVLNMAKKKLIKKIKAKYRK